MTDQTRALSPHEPRAEGTDPRGENALPNSGLPSWQLKMTVREIIRYETEMAEIHRMQRDLERK